MWTPVSEGDTESLCRADSDIGMEIARGMDQSQGQWIADQYDQTLQRSEPESTGADPEWILNQGGNR